MRRHFGRIALDVLTVLSLLICVAALSLWVRSYGHFDFLNLPHGPYASTSFASQRGAVVLVVNRYAYRRGPFHPAFRTRWSVWSSEAMRGVVCYARRGAGGQLWFGTGHEKTPFASWDGSSGSVTTRVVLVPYWSVATVLAVAPALRLRALRIARRRARGNLCPRCDYDLTGNVSGVCPECGTPVVNSPGKCSAALSQPSP